MKTETPFTSSPWVEVLPGMGFNKKTGLKSQDREGSAESRKFFNGDGTGKESVKSFLKMT
ncbi:hypothetical protein [Desulfobotulus mexicanus]|uniref:hypothetical protein n=1 Tax=Desulfobotulus mexicanus TaxID=2586642 RepID=UPI0015D27502|nr:hypothetical protein [Desulfobotulus mexicanus]